MFCARCGERLDDNTKFCPKCGSKVDEGPAGVTAQLRTPQHVSVNPVPPNPQTSGNIPSLPKAHKNRNDLAITAIVSSIVSLLLYGLLKFLTGDINGNLKKDSSDIFGKHGYSIENLSFFVLVIILFTSIVFIIISIIKNRKNKYGLIITLIAAIILIITFLIRVGLYDSLF
jgi:uncharacterized Tic20 family protein